MTHFFRVYLSTKTERQMVFLIFQIQFKIHEETHTHINETQAEKKEKKTTQQSCRQTKKEEKTSI